jgi:hypothetical protein
MADGINDETPDNPPPFPAVVKIAPTGTISNPPMPMKPQLARALQWAAWAIRKKNRGGRQPLV